MPATYMQEQIKKGRLSNRMKRDSDEESSRGRRDMGSHTYSAWHREVDSAGWFGTERLTGYELTKSHQPRSTVSAKSPDVKSRHKLGKLNFFFKTWLIGKTLDS